MRIKAHIGICFGHVIRLEIGQENLGGRLREEYVPDRRIHGIGNILRRHEQGTVGLT